MYFFLILVDLPDFKGSCIDCYLCCWTMSLSLLFFLSQYLYLSICVIPDKHILSFGGLPYSNGSQQWLEMVVAI